MSATNWDFKDQLKSVDLGGGGNAYYNYDSKGRRSRKVWEKSPGVTEERLYIGDFEIFRRRNGAGDIIFERETLHVPEISSDTRGTGKNMMDTEDSGPEEFRGFREKTGQEELSERNGKEKKSVNDGSGKTAMFRYRIGAGSVADSALNISEQTASPHFAIIETRTVGDDGSPSQLISYQYDNHLGSATLELDDSATIISYEEYYPYGMSSYQAVTSQREVCKKRYRFTGKERDEESGLYYFGARYYDPDIGLWTSVDPRAAEFKGLSPYHYNFNNPINFIDPDGEGPLASVIAGGSAGLGTYLRLRNTGLSKTEMGFAVGLSGGVAALIAALPGTELGGAALQGAIASFSTELIAQFAENNFDIKAFSQNVDVPALATATGLGAFSSAIAKIGVGKLISQADVDFNGLSNALQKEVGVSALEATKDLTGAAIGTATESIIMKSLDKE